MKHTKCNSTAIIMEIAKTTTVPELRLEDVYPLIESFSSVLTEEQWRQIEVGAPDNATKAVLANLLLDIIAVVAKVVLATSVNLNAVVHEDCVQSSLDNTLSRSFAEVLGIEDEVQSVSTEGLTDLIVQEVAESVTSALSTSEGSSMEPSINRVTSCQKLKAMVRHACTTLKALKAKMDISCRPKRRQRQRTDNQWNLEDTELADTDGHQSPVGSIQPEATEEVSSEDSYVIKTTKMVQKLIHTNMKDITEPFLEEVADTEYELLQTESSKEIKAVADDIAQIITNKIRSLRETDAAGPSPKSKQSHKVNMKRVKNKVKNFFTKQFAKALILRIVAKVRAKFHMDSTVESSESIQSLMDDVDSLLLTEAGEKQTGELCVVKKFKKTSPGKVHVFTQELSDLLYSHITDRMPHSFPEMTRRRATCRTVSVPWSHAGMYAEIIDNVRRFLGMMNYWVNSCVVSHSNSVIQSLMDMVSLTAQLPDATTVEETYLGACAVSEPEQDNTKQAEQKKMLVCILVKKLIQQVFSKAKLTDTEKEKAISQHVFEKTWAEVERLDVVITQKTFKNLDKDIFKDLCKSWGHVGEVLASMYLERPEIESYIASCVTSYLTAPQRNALSRFISNCKAITDPLTLSI